MTKYGRFDKTASWIRSQDGGQTVVQLPTKTSALEIGIHSVQLDTDWINGEERILEKGLHFASNGLSSVTSQKKFCEPTRF